MVAEVCYVVNAVDETSVPADIATALERYTDASVDLLAWFDAERFDGDDLVGVCCLDAPDTTMGIDRRTYREAREHLREYDLVQAHHNHSGAFAKVIARRLGIPAVSREGNMRRGFNRLGRIANGLTNPLSARVVCNSRAVYDSFTRWERAILPASRVTFIPNGVDFERVEAGRSMAWSAVEAAGLARNGTAGNGGRDRAAGSVGATGSEGAAGPKGEAVLVGTAGLLTEQKDHRTLVEAIAIARERTDADLHLLIAGDGPLEDELRALATERGVADAVHLLGFLERRQVYAMLDELDVYAMPSRWEGFSAAAVEALGSGLPAVFSEIPPFTEPYEGVARFHPVRDADALAGHLVDLAERPDERERLAREGETLVTETYAMETVARQYRDLYEDVLDR